MSFAATVAVVAMDAAFVLVNVAALLWLDGGWFNVAAGAVCVALGADAWRRYRRAA